MKIDNDLEIRERHLDTHLLNNSSTHLPTNSSTHLPLISSTLFLKGRVGALIEVGAGFHPMLTGKENVYINAAILGMTKEEVDEKFDDIVEFADICAFLDTPVKFYSSGMYVRLGFAGGALRACYSVG